MESIYSILNKEAKLWHYHQSLREQNRFTEARALERTSIKSSIKTIRSATILHIARGGFSVYLKPELSLDGTVRSTSKVSGYGNGGVYYKSLLRSRPEVPIVDTNTIPDNLISRFAISGPMIPTGKPDAPNSNGRWGGFSFCPIYVYLAIAESMGATVHWGEFSSMKDKAYADAQATIDYLKS